MFAMAGTIYLVVFISWSPLVFLSCSEWPWEGLDAFKDHLVLGTGRCTISHADAKEGRMDLLKGSELRWKCNCEDMVFGAFSELKRLAEMANMFLWAGLSVSFDLFVYAF
ncbi:hypothetical protein Tco_0010525 [Tanacetum coccineum]